MNNNFLSISSITNSRNTDLIQKLLDNCKIPVQIQFNTMSNNLYPQAFFGSNTALYASNLVINQSNTLNPRSTFGSNTALYASNLIINQSNILNPISVFASNLTVTNSNELYPSSIFASNLATQSLPIMVQPIYISDTNYVTFATFIYSASNKSFNSINLYCYLSSNNDLEVLDPSFTYNIHVIDLLSNVSYQEITYSNWTPIINVFELSNIVPLACIGLQAKKNLLGNRVEILSYGF